MFWKSINEQSLIYYILGSFFQMYPFNIKKNIYASKIVEIGILLKEARFEFNLSNRKPATNAK